MNNFTNISKILAPMFIIFSTLLYYGLDKFNRYYKKNSSLNLIIRVIIVSLPIIGFLLYLIIYCYNRYTDFNAPASNSGEIIWNIIKDILRCILLIILVLTLNKSGLYLLDGSNENFNVISRIIIQLVGGIYAIFSTFIFELINYKNLSKLFEPGMAQGQYLVDFIRMLAIMPFDTVAYEASIKGNNEQCNYRWILYTCYLFIGGYSIISSPFVNIITILFAGYSIANKKLMIKFPNL